MVEATASLGLWLATIPQRDALTCHDTGAGLVYDYSDCQVKHLARFAFNGADLGKQLVRMAVVVRYVRNNSMSTRKTEEKLKRQLPCFGWFPFKNVAPRGQSRGQNWPE
jgi:hypothetical protein